MSIISKNNADHVTPERYGSAIHILQTVFRHASFREHQYEIIDHILNQTDVIAIMSTGYGKSTCFQLPPLLSNELCIVVSPLIALMADQQSSLSAIGVNSCCYNSSIGIKNKREIEANLLAGKYHLLYITPETLIRSHDLIDKIYETQGICMIAIDEAHCISSYGFDFRTSYRELCKVREYLPNVPVLAVTATATEKVINDIKTVMKMNKCVIIKTSFDRPNLKIHVALYTKDATNNIIHLVQQSTGSCIIYCLTKSDTDMMSKILQQANVTCGAYHAGLDSKTRSLIQNEFMTNKLKCITATIAFGMGINKPDIRTIIHFGCPQNIESYYQEIGRAGRDGKPAVCHLFYREKDFIIQKHIIEEIQNVEYRATRSRLLQIMSQYIFLSSCRRKYILNYFNEKESAIICNNCDNCIKREPIVMVDKSKAKKVIGVLLQTKGSFGIGTLGLILKGSKCKKITHSMINCPLYGSLSNLTLPQIGDVIHDSINAGYIELVDVKNCIHILQPTYAGIELLHKNGDIDA